MLVLADPVGGGVTADLRYARSVAARRAAGTVSGLTVALANLVLAETSLGKWPDAIEIGTEGLRLARETGQEAMASYFLAMLAGIAAERGRSKECRRLVHEALAAAVPRRPAVVAVFTSWTLAALDLAEGRPAAALGRLRALSTPQHPTAHAAIAQLPLELARTELLYGESLRRARRRADARRHLRTALDLFKQLGASPWAERAASELRASGETARRRDPSTLQQLTPRNCGSHASPVGD